MLAINDVRTEIKKSTLSTITLDNEEMHIYLTLDSGFRLPRAAYWKHIVAIIDIAWI